MYRFAIVLFASIAGCSAQGLPLLDGTQPGAMRDASVSDQGASGLTADLASRYDAALVNDMLRAPDLAGMDMAVSAAPCLTGGSIAYLDGDPADWIHPGAEVIRVASWFPRSKDNDTFWYESPHKGDGSGGWTFGFSALEIGQPLAVGHYDNAMAIGSVMPGRPGLSISGDSRICSNIDGWFEIESIAGGPINGTYTELTATFEQHCSGLAGALRGCVHFEN